MQLVEFARFALYHGPTVPWRPFSFRFLSQLSEVSRHNDPPPPRIDHVFHLKPSTDTHTSRRLPPC
ncbi:MAG TPA: hypothetical protein DCE43_25480 [Planctomycetaceae bacterium]|nr:hypothetical protein [Planctomycetaceae bacterium]